MRVCRISSAMPPKGKGLRHARKRGREPLKEQMGIMAFFGGNGVRASSSGSESIPGKSKPIPSSVVDLTGGSNDRSCLPPTKVSDSRDTRYQNSAEIVRKSSPASLRRDISGVTNGVCSDELITTVSRSSRFPATSASGVGFVKASNLVRKCQPQQGTETVLSAMSAPKGTTTSWSPSPQETVDFSSCSSLNDHHGTSVGGVDKQRNVLGESQEFEIVSTPADAATASFNNGADAKRLVSWGSLSSSKRSFGGRGHRSDPVTLPLHVVGFQFRDLPPSDQHQHNATVEPGTALVLEREPWNSHDENAIKVLLPASLGSRFLGYIPGRIASLLAPIIDAVSGTVARVTLKTQEEESVIGRQTLPAVLEVQPLSGAKKEPFAGSLVKVIFVGMARGMKN